jgi:succinyl-CoA synthetase beta subunit
MSSVLTKEMEHILATWKDAGWVPEPDAKRMFSLAGFDVPRFAWAKNTDDACTFASEIGYPVVAKVVSPLIVHKSDAGGVAVGVENDERLCEVFERFSAMDGFDGIVVDETVPGIELIVGAAIDSQFGPVVMVGIGGVGVELYRDTAIRMAPLEPRDVESMVDSLTAHRLIEGFRGSEPINIDIFTSLVVHFSEFVMALEEHVESIDLNPVMCSSKRCVIADARVILRGGDR